jgi:hypothetical protein
MNNGIKFLLAILFIIAAVKAYEFDQFEDMVAQKCTTTQLVGIGERCDYEYPKDANITYSCAREGACQNSTTPTCVVSVAYNSDCEGEGNEPCPHSASLQCIEGKCTIKGKIYDEPCFHDDECFSGMCREGRCFAHAIGENCTADIECIWSQSQGLFTYCDANNTCAEYIEVGGACSADYKCHPDKADCIDEVCVARAKEGEECSTSEIGKPSCGDKLHCIDDKCIAENSKGVFEEAQFVSLCQKGLASNGTHCLPKDQVVCDDSNTDIRCKGFCKCNPDHIEGTCDELTVNCESQENALDQCVRDKCVGSHSHGRAFLFAKDGCVEKHCADQRKAYYCCMSELTQYIPYKEFDKAICTTPTPSPKPSPVPSPIPSPIPSPKLSPTPSPTPSPKLSPKPAPIQSPVQSPTVPGKSTGNGVGKVESSSLFIILFMLWFIIVHQ